MSLLWRVRREDDRGSGRAVGFPRLSQGIVNGVWGESDEVLAPGGLHWQLIAEQPQLAEYVPRKEVFKSRKSEEAEMDMTPMIDVTFQLLIFFMIAATYMVQKTLEMPKPEASQEDGASQTTMQELEKNNIVVKIAADKTVTLAGQTVKLADLPAALVKAVAASKNAELVLDVHDDVDHETVVRALDAAGAAEIEKVHFISHVAAKPP